MIKITEDIWSDLHGKKADPGMMAAKRVHPDYGLYLAVDHQGNRHALLPINDLNQGFTDRRSRGLTVSCENLMLESRPTSPYLDLQCNDKGSYASFHIVVCDVLERLMSGADPAAAVKSTLARWRRFWGTGLGSALSSEAARGLFGELWFLRVWLLPHGSAAVHKWIGPTGARHDFQWHHQAVEVKTTTASGHVHRINGLDQLSNPDSGRLYLFSLRVREEPAAHNNLTSIIQAISSGLVSDPEALDTFEQRLTQVGYSPFHDDIYRQWNYRIAEERLYLVTEGFPRLATTSFVNGLPAGVERVDYVINLDVCPQLCVSRSPATPALTFTD